MATRIFREIRAGDMFASPKEATENEVIQGPTRFTSLAWPYTDRAPVSDRRTGSPCESAATKAGTRNYRARAWRLFVAINGLNYLAIRAQHPPSPRMRIKT